jgi:hypothetical protein
VAFVTNLAAALDGISASEISVTASQGSVVVAVTILTTNVAAGEAAFRFVAAGDTSSLSAALGITVLSVTAPQSTTTTVCAQDCDDDSNTPLIIGLAVGGAVLVVIFIGVLACLYTKQKQSKMKNVDVSSTSTSPD